jgi:hypothetical protein
MRQESMEINQSSREASSQVARITTSQEPTSGRLWLAKVVSLLSIVHCEYMYV